MKAIIELLCSLMVLIPEVRVNASPVYAQNLAALTLAKRSLILSRGQRQVLVPRAPKGGKGGGPLRQQSLGEGTPPGAEPFPLDAKEGKEGKAKALLGNLLDLPTSLLGVGKDGAPLPPELLGKAGELGRGGLPIPPELLGRKGVPPELLGGKGVPAELLGGKGVPPELLGGKGVPAELLGGKGVPAELLGGKGVPPELLGGKGVPSELLGGKSVPPELLGGKGAAPELLGGKGVPSELLGGKGVAQDLLGGKGVPPELLGIGAPILPERAGGPVPPANPGSLGLEPAGKLTKGG